MFVERRLRERDVRSTREREQAFRQVVNLCQLRFQGIDDVAALVELRRMGSVERILGGCPRRAVGDTHKLIVLLLYHFVHEYFHPLLRGT